MTGPRKGSPSERIRLATGEIRACWPLRHDSRWARRLVRAWVGELRLARKELLP